MTNPINPNQTLSQPYPNSTLTLPQPYPKPIPNLSQPYPNPILTLPQPNTNPNSTPMQTQPYLNPTLTQFDQFRLFGVSKKFVVGGVVCLIIVSAPGPGLVKS